MGPSKKGRLPSVLALAVLASAATAGFTPPDIASAEFIVNFAEFTGARSIGGTQVNYARLMDGSGQGVNPFDMSDALFGAVGSPPVITQGVTQTGLVSVAIPSWFFPAMSTGRVVFWGTFTDTADGAFAMDYISIRITTTGGVTTNYYYGSTPNGFGLGIPVGGVLPGPAFNVLQHTGTGFDEVVSSKSFHATILTPAPSGVCALGLFVAASSRRRRR